MHLKLFFLILFTESIYSDSGGMGDDVEYESAFDQELYERVLDPNKCEEQLVFLTRNVSIGMQFIDSSGRIPSGILSGNLADLGSYHECLNIRHLSDDMDIEGKYCMIQMPLEQDLEPKSIVAPNFSEINIMDIWPRVDNKTIDDVTEFMQLQRLAQILMAPEKPTVSRVIPAKFVSAMIMSLGVCVPKVCRSKQAIDFFLNRSFPSANLTYSEVFCRLPNDKPMSIADYVAICILVLIILTTIISTSYNLFLVFALKRENSQINRFYRSFSIYTNTKRLLSFNTVPGAVECIDGIRAISMLWVIVGHTHSMTMMIFVINMKDVRDWLISIKSIWINAAPISVDTFFTLSGVLCVYTVIGKISACRFIKSVHFFYLHRLLRIFPLLAIAVLLQASLFHRMSDGPMWLNIGHATVMCRERWWAALLHVQNYVKPIGICLYQTWYLSVDIQLYFVSPVVLVWLFGTATVAWCVLASAVVVSLILSSTFSFLYNYSAAISNPSRMNEFSDYFMNYYINTLTRAPPFFIGMIYGYLLHRCRGKKIRMSKISVAITWIFAFALMAFCIFTIYPIMQKDHDLQMFDNFLNAYMRGIWAAALGWLIFACAHGYGGPINWFLSLQIWKLPARLSYAMYLIHFPIMMVANGNMTTTYYFNDAKTLYRAMGDVMITVIAAFILCVTVDAPFSTIQKMLLGLGKKKPNTIHGNVRVPQS